MVHMKVMIKVRPTKTPLPMAAMKRTTPCRWKKLRLMKNLSPKLQISPSTAAMPKHIAMMKAMEMMANMVMS